MAFERIVVNRSATLYKTFYSGGVAMDPDSTPTVTITRDDGTTVTAGGVVDEAGTGTYSVTIPASENDQLDRLTVDWAAVVNTEPQEFLDTVEVAGGTLFTIAEARAVKPLDNTTTYPEAAIVAMRNRVEQALEDVCGVAFVPRYERETIIGDGTMTALLKWPLIRDIRSAQATYQGSTTTLTASDITNLAFTPMGTVYGYPWTFGYPWSIAYEHGYDRPPERVRQAALRLARSWLVAGPIDDRASTFNAGADGGTYSLSIPGGEGSPFGMPEVDATVKEYSLRVEVA